jgi:hypothetical protein
MYCLISVKRENRKDRTILSLLFFLVVTHQSNGDQIKEEEDAEDEFIDYLFMRTSSNIDG